MTKTLQQIKDEYAESWGHFNWNEFKRYESVLKVSEGYDQIAIRYAQEQKRELVEMLEIINEGINTMDFTQLEVLHNEIESLITKHKQS